VLLTDGPLDSAACARVARRAGLGLARVGSTARNGSGEIFLAAATGLRADRGRSAEGQRVSGADVSPYFAAAVDVTESAALNSMLQARTVTGYQGNSSLGLDAEDVVRRLTAYRRG
jgi:D-aminopeptidase